MQGNRGAKPLGGSRNGKIIGEVIANGIPSRKTWFALVGHLLWKSREVFVKETRD